MAVGGEKRVENPLQIIAADPCAIIGENNFYPILFNAAAEVNFTTVAVFKPMHYRILCQVSNDLANSAWIAVHYNVIRATYPQHDLPAAPHQA